jgi:hypothetical protein
MKVKLPLELLKRMSEWQTDTSWGDMRLIWKAGKVIKWYDNKGHEIPTTEYGVEVTFFDDTPAFQPPKHRKPLKQAVKEKMSDV